jgi:hypothetical protein
MFKGDSTFSIWMMFIITKGICYVISSLQYLLFKLMRGGVNRDNLTFELGIHTPTHPFILSMTNLYIMLGIDKPVVIYIELSIHESIIVCQELGVHKLTHLYI